MTSRINTHQLRSHTYCAQRWKSAVIRLWECYKIRSGTCKNSVIKRSTFQMPPWKEWLIKSLADVRNREGVGQRRSQVCTEPDGQPQDTNLGVGMEACPRQSVAAQALLLIQGPQHPTLDSMLDPVLELPLHLILGLGWFPDCREDIHSHIRQLRSPKVTAKLVSLAHYPWFFIFLLLH